MEEMVKGCPVKKLALLHMDGNDLGKFFLAAQERVASKSESPAAQNKEMNALSALIEEANQHAFAEALISIIRLDLENKKIGAAENVVEVSYNNYETVIRNTAEDKSRLYAKREALINALDQLTNASQIQKVHAAIAAIDSKLQSIAEIVITSG